MNKCIKVVIAKCGEMKNYKKVLGDLRYQSWMACNKAITYFYTFALENMEYSKETGSNINEKERYGKSFGSWVENRMNEIMTLHNSCNIAQTRQFVTKRFSEDRKKGLFIGHISLSNFRQDIPIIVHNRSYRIIQGNSGYIIECGLFNKDYQQKNNIKRVNFTIDNLDNNKKSTLDKIISGKYKQGSIQIIEDKKGKWYFIISYRFEPEIAPLSKDRILGVDIGVVNLATMQIYDNNKKAWDWLSIKYYNIPCEELIHKRQQLYAMGYSNSEIEKEIKKLNQKLEDRMFRENKTYMINGNRLLEVRSKIEKQRRSLKIATKWCAEGRIGHGQNTRCKPVERISNKIGNFKEIYNHKVSKYIIEFAMKHNCGIIQMENLSGFSEYQSESLLKNWAYYDLQSKIKYKAEEKGIEVKFINPRYTSQRCSNCGSISKDNRDCKANQSKFECVICGHKENADTNAAKNISLPDIESIIKDYIEKSSIQ